MFLASTTLGTGAVSGATYRSVGTEPTSLQLTALAEAAQVDAAAHSGLSAKRRIGVARQSHRDLAVTLAHHADDERPPRSVSL